MHRQSPFAGRGELESNGGASERRSCRGGTKSDAKDRISFYRVCLCRPSCSDIACVRVIFPAASTCAGAISGIAGSTILLKVAVQVQVVIQPLLEQRQVIVVAACLATLVGREELAPVFPFLGAYRPGQLPPGVACGCQ